MTCTQKIYSITEKAHLCLIQQCGSRLRMEGVTQTLFFFLFYECPDFCRGRITINAARPIWTTDWPWSGFYESIRNSLLLLHTGVRRLSRHLRSIKKGRDHSNPQRHKGPFTHPNSSAKPITQTQTLCFVKPIETKLSITHQGYVNQDNLPGP